MLVGGLCVCAVSLGRSLFPLLPVPPHFFALAQRNGVEPQRNALMGAATVAVGSRPPLPRTRSPNITADCVKLTLPGQLTNRPQINLTHQFVPLGLTPEWERRVGPPSSCGGFKALFFGGSTPFLWASTKEMGSNGRTGHRPPPSVTAHTHKAKEKGEPPARVPPWTPSCAFVSIRRVPRSAERGQRLCLWTPPPLKRRAKLSFALRAGKGVRTLYGDRCRGISTRRGRGRRALSRRR